MYSGRDSQVIKGSLISSTSSDYEVQDILGSGAFGDVTQCKKLATNEIVAVKMIRNAKCIEKAKHEEMTLKMMRALGSERFNIIRWNDSFMYGGHFCLEFEKLDVNLFEFMLEQFSHLLGLATVRPILHQLATALEFLKRAGIIHADLKPENIMMVDHLHQPLRVKVIDFGLACNEPKEKTGATLQTLYYRSPEVLLGCPFNEAIDVWSLGCIAAEMMTGAVLFPARYEYELMSQIASLIGRPPDHMLDAGRYTMLYHAKHVFSLVWWRAYSRCNPYMITSLSKLRTLRQSVTGEEARAEACDRASFVNLLTKMLKLDAAERITPSQILQHQFMTMSHLVGTFGSSSYVRQSTEQMSICRLSSCRQDAAQVAAVVDTCDSIASHDVNSQDHYMGPSSRGNCPAEKKRLRSRDTGGTGDYNYRNPQSCQARRRRSKRLLAVKAKMGLFRE